MTFYTIILTAVVATTLVMVDAAKLSYDLAAIDSEWAGRIVGGHVADPNQFPHQVSLQNVATGNHFCAGFILSKRWIGTVAHCAVNRLPEAVLARVGSNNRASGGILHTIIQIRIHPEYSPQLLANDIAAVQTTDDILFTLAIEPIALASIYHGVEDVVVSGWGQTSHPGQSTDILQWKNTTTLLNLDCQARHTAGNAQNIYEHNICTFTQLGEGACMGDSGGALIHADGTVIGAVSWGVACAQGFPDVYVRISSFRVWFLENLEH